MTTPTDLQRLLAEEPFVRSLATALLVDDADEVVQQTLLHALQHRPAGLTQPRAWLARVVRNLVTDHRRRDRRRAARERAAAVSERLPSSADLLATEERRRLLVAAVDGLAPALRTVLLLRYYEGLPPRRIATELDLPVTTVWNRLRSALAQLRTRLDAEHGGDRRAWLLPLVPFATAPRALPWRELAQPVGPSLLTGVLAMTTKSKIVALAAALLLLTFGLVLASLAGAPTGRGDVPAPPLAVAAHADMAQSPPADQEPRHEVVAGDQPTPTTGSLLVQVRYADEPHAASGLAVFVRRAGDDPKIGMPRAVTDAEGKATFSGLMPGNVLVVSTRCGNARAEVHAGEDNAVDLLLHQAVTLSGVVVDAVGVPVAGALVESCRRDHPDDPEVVATTDANGTFVLRACWQELLIGARAAGHAASELQFVAVRTAEASEQVRIVLGTPGGSVEGIVVGPDARPVANALVRVGDGRTDGIRPSFQGAPPLPAQVRTDAMGRFTAIGVPVGTGSVQVRAAGLAPWRGTCEVVASATVPIRVQLTTGVTCIGSVLAADGKPLGGIDVTVGDRGDFLQYRALSGADGSFTLVGLPIGESELRSNDRELGRAAVLVRGDSNSTVRCELVLSNGLQLRGRIVDPAGAPVPGAACSCRAEGDPLWNGYARIAADGNFMVPHCPEGRLLTLAVTARGWLAQQRTGVDPRAGELRIELARDTAAPARIVGRVLGPEGQPVAGVEVNGSRSAPSHDNCCAEVRADGTFGLELAAGVWQLGVNEVGQQRVYPSVSLGKRELQPGSVWDLGTITLTHGGTLVARVAEGRKPRLMILDDREKFFGWVSSPVPPLRSNLLAPGNYLLLVEGDGIAAHAQPFTITADRETEVEVELPAGVRQHVEFVQPQGAVPPDFLSFEVRNGGKLVLWDQSSKSPGMQTADLWLAPGEYELTTRNGPSGRASFTVGREVGSTVRVQVR